MRERQHLETQIGAVEHMERELADQSELIELGEAEDDKAVVADAEAALRALGAEAEHRQVESMLSGEADHLDAFLEVHAGAGGTESQDWAQMLMRMYTRWAEQSGYKVARSWKSTTAKRPASSRRRCRCRAPAPMAG